MFVWWEGSPIDKEGGRCPPATTYNKGAIMQVAAMYPLVGRTTLRLTIWWVTTYHLLHMQGVQPHIKLTRPSHQSSHNHSNSSTFKKHSHCVASGPQMNEDAAYVNVPLPLKDLIISQKKSNSKGKKLAHGHISQPS